MAGVTLPVTIDARAALASLDSLQAALDAPGDLLHRAGEYLVGSTRERFRTQSDPRGRGWNPLEPNYRRSKKYNKDKILTLRGHLRSSIRWQPDGPGAIEVGTNLSYAAIHQFGGTIQHHAQSRLQRFRTSNGRNLFAKRTARGAGVTDRWTSRPAYQVSVTARPFLGLSRTDEAHLQQLLNDWLADHLK